MKGKRIRPLQSGFSLIEVCFALGIFGTCLFMYTYSANFGAKGAAKADFRTRAVLVSESLLEELLNNTDIDPRLTAGEHKALYDRAGRPVSENAFFTATWTVEEAKPIEGVTEIELVVSWVEGFQPQRVRFVTNRRAW